MNVSAPLDPFGRLGIGAVAFGGVGVFSVDLVRYLKMEIAPREGGYLGGRLT